MSLILIAAPAIFLFIGQAGATIDVTLQMQLGNPSGATADVNNHDHYLIQRPVEAIDYSDNLREPNWASWDLTAGDVGSSGRSSSFFADTNLPPSFYEVQPGDYSGSGFDRGHMCPSDDRTDNTADNDMVFFMSNIIPQSSSNNQGVWANFETYCRSLAQSGNELLITCGPSGFNGSRTTSSGSIAIPAYTWKIAVVVPLGSGTALSRITAATRVITIKVPNSNSVSSTWQDFVTSANQIQVDTGFTFFTALSPQIASALRSEVDGQTNPAPVITGFSPANGAVNASIVITGTNFGSAAAVTFNGVSAAYSVDSATQITATVPANATSGQISVTTPSGTAISSNSFTVTGLPIDLAITTTHPGNFTQGDSGDSYTIIVSNVGSSASTGTVTVTDALPAGLTATAISGAGWTTNIGTLTCTRPDALAAGTSYPPITITVNVATNAPASVTNMATVSGGGDANPTNNTASDVTTINTSGGGSTNTLILAGWDASGQTNYGVSPFAPTTNAPNLMVTTGLTRGSGVGTGGTAAARAWGGNTFTGASSATAIAANQFVTFAIAANAGYQVSYSSISPFNYRHSASGPTNGLLQFQIGSGAFNDIATVAYPTNTSAGGTLSPINLSGIAALQNVGPGSNVTFRIVNWGGTNSAGTWYIFDGANSTAADFAVQGTVNAILAPVQSWRLQWFGTTANSGMAADTNKVTSDGMPNLLKYALGLNPLIPTNSPVVGDISTGHLRLTLPKNPNASDVSFYVEVTGNLTAGWTTNGTTIDQNTSTMLQVHDNVPVGSAGERFIRLRVSRP
ncbi:MAG TPA: DNA/RNA non-specific endonuclease [Verrucomicrobiae bacterium]|nr:DNA/RNA non-specific endonuclease [Verrucomicrobiae bacterium]